MPSGVQVQILSPALKTETYLKQNKQIMEGGVNMPSAEPLYAPAQNLTYIFGVIVIIIIIFILFKIFQFARRSKK